MKTLTGIFHKNCRMTKTERVEKTAKDAGISKAAANKTLDSFVDAVTIALKTRQAHTDQTQIGNFGDVTDYVE